MRMVSMAMLVAGCLCVALPAHADNPGFDRPGYGFAPGVLAAGDITVEQGLPDWSRDRADGSSSSMYSADSLIRIGLGGPVELQLGSTPWNSLRQTGPGLETRSHGRGDSNLALKLALPSSNQAFTWGVLGSVEFTDGSPDFRNDRRQYLLGAQFNLQANERNSLGAYLEDVRSGDSNSTTAAISDNYTLTRTLVAYAEAALLHSPDQGSGTVGGAGLTWMATSRVQLDAGFDHRLGGHASQWQTNLGISVFFGH
ncbi:MAG: transporter [Rhodanobacter sp.]